MDENKHPLHVFLEGLLPSPLKPHTFKVFLAIAIIVALMLCGVAFGFRWILMWFLGTLFLIVFMAVWVILSEVFRKLRE